MAKYKIYGLYSSQYPNDVKYIGYTKKPLNQRLSCHIYDYNIGKNTLKTRWICDTLNNGYKILIKEIDTVIEDDCYILESYYISYYKSLGANLVNSNNGGGGTLTRDEAHSHWLSIRNKGNKNMLGKKHSDESKKKISAGLMGRPSPMKGKKFSTEWKEKLSKAKIGKFPGNRAKPVIQYSFDNIFINEWSSALLASKTLGVNKNSICQCVLGKYKTAGGFKWKYKT